MAEYKRTNVDGSPTDKVKTKYIGTTKRKCPTCSKANMMVKQRVEGTSTLECPNCELIENVPTSAEKHV